MTPRGGAREGAGRKPRLEPKSRAIWCGQMSEQDRALIMDTLTPDERFDALMDAVLIKQAKGEGEMNEYFECVNCGQVVQGFNASRQVDCCERPSYARVPGPEGDSRNPTPSEIDWLRAQAGLSGGQPG